ncbi:MAG: zinc ribbon domain-containing protein [Phycisphaerales bacterium]|nr:zinc ribbon domain-containing protein [Phycisphaerales bacterium]
MPMYEYEAADGTRVEVLRPIADADKPLPDPDGKGRTFKRVMSVFSSGGSGGSSSTKSTGGHVHSGSCGCGRFPGGSCGG